MGDPQDSDTYSSTETDTGKDPKAPKENKDATDLGIDEAGVGDNPGNGGDGTPTSNPPGT